MWVLGRVYIKGHWRSYEMILMIMMVNDIRGWKGPKFSRHLSYSRGKTSEETSTRTTDLTRDRIRAR